MKLKEIYNNKIERDVNPAVSITDESDNTIYALVKIDGEYKLQKYAMS